jgi:hypothetical protein
MQLLLASCAAGWGIGLVVLAGFHATWTIGVTGGPNHGEHPFIVNVVHLAVTFGTLGDWPVQLRWTYRGLVAVGIVLGIIAIRLVDAGPGAKWAARVAMILLYLGLLGILFWGR